MSYVLFEIKDSIGLITLNRPDKLNSFNREMALLMQEKLDACKSKEVRCVYITGAGRGFSAGQDLSEVAEPGAPGFNVILSEHYNPIVTRIRKLEKPVVAAVNGVAAGAGANIALCCDIVVAAQSASFLQAFSKIGLIPDSSGTFMLPRLIGWQKATALIMRNNQFKLQFNKLQTGDYTVELTNVTGEQVMTQKVNVAGEGQVHTISLKKNTAQGIYLVKVTDIYGKSIFTQKLVVQ